MKENHKIQVVYPEGQQQLNEVRKLMRAFVAWHRQRNWQDIALIDEYYDALAFEEELASLPGKYTKPEGSLLLALYNGERAGCVALRKIDGTDCEMKKMFVYDHLQGKGIGRILVEKIIAEARLAGYSTIKLDTSFRQTEAQKLYESFGFQRTGPYYEMPDKVRDWLVFMELKL